MFERLHTKYKCPPGRRSWPRQWRRKILFLIELNLINQYNADTNNNTLTARPELGWISVKITLFFIHPKLFWNWIFLEEVQKSFLFKSFHGLYFIWNTFVFKLITKNIAVSVSTAQSDHLTLKDRQGEVNGK